MGFLLRRWARASPWWREDCSSSLPCLIGSLGNALGLNQPVHETSNASAGATFFRNTGAQPAGGGRAPRARSAVSACKCYGVVRLRAPFLRLWGPRCSASHDEEAQVGHTACARRPNRSLHAAESCRAAGALSARVFRRPAMLRRTQARWPDW